MKDAQFLKKSQQGELDAVPMYLNLAKKFEANEQVAAMLKEMAADEGRHASVFKNLSGKTQKPKMFLAKVVPVLMSLLGKKTMFKIIANNEYSAYDTYAPWIEKFPEIEAVRADEKKHGDMATEIITLL